MVFAKKQPIKETGTGLEDISGDLDSVSSPFCALEQGGNALCICAQLSAICLSHKSLDTWTQAFGSWFTSNLLCIYVYIYICIQHALKGIETEASLKIRVLEHLKHSLRGTSLYPMTCLRANEMSAPFGPNQCGGDIETCTLSAPPKTSPSGA